MSRVHGTNTAGRHFSSSEVIEVWKRGIAIPGYDSNEWRKDVVGNLIKFEEHGNTNSMYGWEVDHIKPVSKNGTDELINLQPLQWNTNREKGDTYPWHGMY